MSNTAGASVRWSPTSIRCSSFFLPGLFSCSRNGWTLPSVREASTISFKNRPPGSRSCGNPFKRSCWLPRFCTPMKRASPSKENGIGSMWPAHRKPRGCFAIPNGDGKRWRPSVFSPVSGNHHARCMGAIFSVHRGRTRPVQRPLASRAAGLARSVSAGLGETLKRPVA